MSEDKSFDSRALTKTYRAIGQWTLATTAVAAAVLAFGSMITFVVWCVVKATWPAL